MSYVAYLKMRFPSFLAVRRAWVAVAAVFCVLGVGCGGGPLGREVARPAFDVERPARTPTSPGSPGREVARPAFDMDITEELSFVSDTGGGWQVFVTRDGLASSVPVGRSGGPHLSAEWSLDGTRGIVSYPVPLDDQGRELEDPDSGLFVVDSDGNDLWRISRTGGYETWSPVGDRIAYADNGGEWLGDSGGFVVYVVNAGGTGAPQEIGYGCCPEWSPSGTQIMYRHPTGPDTWGLTVAEVDGGSSWAINECQFPVDPELGFSFGSQDGTWSPDGQKIAYTYCDEIHIVHADGTGARRLIGGDDYLFDPKWSPDGQWIAYGARLNAGRSSSHKLWVADAFGKNGELVSEMERDTHVWSPDSTRIAYVTESGGLPGVIMVASLVGDDGPIAVSPPGSSSPAWSRDSLRIAFSSPGYTQSNPEGDAEIFVVDADGGNLVQITNNIHGDHRPEWVRSSSLPPPTPLPTSPPDAERDDDLGGENWVDVLSSTGNMEEGCNDVVRIAARNNAGQDAYNFLREVFGSEHFATNGISAEELIATLVGFELPMFGVGYECGHLYEEADAFRIGYWMVSLMHEIGYFLKDSDNFVKDIEDLEDEWGLGSPLFSLAGIGRWSTDEELRLFCEGENAIRRQYPGWSDRLLSQSDVVYVLGSMFEDRSLSYAFWLGQQIASVTFWCDLNGENDRSKNFPPQYYAMLSKLEGQ